MRGSLLLFTAEVSILLPGMRKLVVTPAPLLLSLESQMGKHIDTLTFGRAGHLQYFFYLFLCPSYLKSLPLVKLTRYKMQKTSFFIIEKI